MLGIAVQEGSTDTLFTVLVDIEGSFEILNDPFYCYFMCVFGIVTVSSYIVDCISNLTSCVVC